MKRIFSIMIFFIFIFQLSIRAQDVIVVEPGFGTLNDAITANGYDKIYQLNRGGFYQTNGPIITDAGTTLRVIGEPAPSSGTDLGPAIIQPGLLNDNTVPQWIFDVNGNFTLKNIWILSWTPLDGQHWTDIRFQGDNTRIIVDNCIFEWNQGPQMEVNGGNTKIYVTNSVFRNQIDPTQWWAGRFIYIINNRGLDSLFAENNTFINEGFTWQNQLRPCNSFWWNHNTMINIAKFALMEELPTYAVVTNNIYVNCHFTGERMQDRGGQDPDRLLYGACLIIDTLPPGFDSLSAVTELERKVIFSNNSNYLDPKFQVFYDQYNETSEDPILAEPVMNERTANMFNWHPFFKLGPIYDGENPAFTVPSDNMDKMIEFCQSRYSTAPSPVNWGWDPDNCDPSMSPELQTCWPLPEKLDYTNTTLLAGGMGGFPLGDLNWFPAQKTAWEAQAAQERQNIINALTDVKQVKSNIPNRYKLSQNFPNPFNPVTNIEFSLPKNSNVTLKVFNVLGEEIATLVNENKNAGTYNVDFNASKLTSGIYIYRLSAWTPSEEAGSFTSTRKMVLMK